MSKYIIEIPDGTKYGILTCRTSNGYYTQDIDLDTLEELNSDYINENFGELQDEAYQRGIEDGKWKAEDGCDGCKYYEDTSLTNPCSECSRGHVDHYKPVSDLDRIEVGDEVIDKDGDKTIVTNIHERLFDGLCDDGSTMSDLFLEDVKKTGKHYDHISNLLEAIRTHD